MVMGFPRMVLTLLLPLYLQRLLRLSIVALFTHSVSSSSSEHQKRNQHRNQKSSKMSDNNPEIESSTLINLNYDVTESILSHLPVSSLVRFTLVSKLWRSIIISLPPSSSSSYSSPWLFLLGIHNTSSFHNQSFALDPLSNTWLRLPSSSSFPSDHLVGSNRFLFTTAPKFSFSPILKPNWRFTSPVRFPRTNPLLSVFTTLSGYSKLILVGGSSRIGGLVDIEERLVVQVYDPNLDSWEICGYRAQIALYGKIKTQIALYDKKTKLPLMKVDKG